MVILSYDSFVRFHGKKLWSHKITVTVLHPNPRYIKVFYKGTALYINARLFAEAAVHSNTVILLLLVLVFS